MSKELKECPFCGEEAQFERTGTRRRSCIVVCTECGARHEGPDEYEESGEAWNIRQYKHDEKSRPEINGILKEELTVLQPYLTGCNVEIMTDLINSIADRLIGTEIISKK